jgi:hypothetical protein
MKLSAQHGSSGLSGSIRSIQTGEILHFQFNAKRTTVPVEVVLGDKRIEAMLRIESVTAGAGDDLDMVLTLRAPEGRPAPAESLDYVPRIAPPPGPGGRIDTDGGAMMPSNPTDEVVIADAPPTEVREYVISEEDREKYPITPTELAISQGEESGHDPYAGEERVGDPKPSNDEHPATKIPSLAGVGENRAKKRGR